MADPVSAAILATGSAASPVLGVLASNASSHKQYKYQSRLQAQAAALNFMYGQQSLLDSPSNTRKGLESAGYNPMLAVQNATSGANAGWTSSGQASGFDSSQALASGVSNAMDFQRLKNETESTASQVKLNESQSRNVVADAIGKEIHNEFLADRERAEIGNIGAQTIKLNRETDYFDALEDNLKARLELDRDLGFAGLDVQRYGIDKSYNASTYATDSKFASDIYGIDVSHPFAKDYVGSIYDDKEVRRALENSIRKNAYRHPKFR